MTIRLALTYLPTLATSALTWLAYPGICGLVAGLIDRFDIRDGAAVLAHKLVISRFMTTGIAFIATLIATWIPYLA